MFTLARESRGLMQSELAEKLKTNQSTVSRIELEQSPLTEEIVEAAHKVLHYPKSFFSQEGEILPSTLSYRKRNNVAQKLLMPIEAQINIFRLNAEKIFSKMNISAPIIPVLDLRELKFPAKAARILRKKWKIAKGPIDNMTALLEENGIAVIAFDFGTERVDSRTILTKNQHPVIFINKTMQADRQRFSLAYELGHLVMHVFTPPSFDLDIQHEANLFAAEFLMPAEDIANDLKEVTIPKLAELKRKWKISMQALLFRASDLGKITDNQKKYLLEQFNKLNIRRREPVELDVAIEKPTLIRDLISKYRKAQRMSLKEMADFVCLEEDEFLKKYAD